MATDPVALAFANANRPRADLDSLYARQRQAGQDAMQYASQFSSMANRAKALEQQAYQFNVTQDLRERQLALQSEQSMVELSAAKLNQDRQAIELGMAKQKLDEQPLRDAANLKLSQLLSSDNNPDGFADKMQREISRDPDIVKYVPPAEREAAILARQRALLNTDFVLAQEKMKNQQLETVVTATRLGVDPENFTDIQTGKLDMTSLLEAISAKQRASQAEERAFQERMSDKAFERQKELYGIKAAAQVAAKVDSSGMVTEVVEWDEFGKPAKTIRRKATPEELSGEAPEKQDKLEPYKSFFKTSQ